MKARFAVSLALWSMVSACASEESKDKRTQPSEADQAPVDETPVQADEFDALSLTQSQCQDPATFAKLTASVSGTLFINSPEVVNDARAKGEGKWSFAYLMREILELPAPGTTPALLSAEQAAVDGFIAKFNQSGNVNGLPPLVATRPAILSSHHGEPVRVLMVSHTGPLPMRRSSWWQS